MLKKVRQRLALIVVSFLAGLGAWLVLRNLAVASLTALAAGASAQALAAGTGKAAVVHVHGPAVIGAAAGSLLLLLNLKGRPWPERAILVVTSFVSAYFGAQLAFELWGWGPGGVGVAGTVCAYLFVAVMDSALALVKDLPWIKQLIERFTPGGAREGS